MAAHKAMYPTLDAYYAADERRLRSEEADYGVHWRLDGWEYRWRVSYVRNTGEIYAVNQGCTIGPVFVLARAVRPSDSLRWVRDRLASVDVTLLVLQRRLTSADLDISLCQTGTVLKRGWLCDPLIRSFKRGSPNPSL